MTPNTKSTKRNTYQQEHKHTEQKKRKTNSNKHLHRTQDIPNTHKHEDASLSQRRAHTEERITNKTNMYKKNKSNEIRNHMIHY